MIDVILNDSNIPYDKVYTHFMAADQWAKKNCPSYRNYETIDVSDFSHEHDVLATYTFDDERDVLIFKLKWQ